VRLLGADTPETNIENKKGEYGDIIDTGCLEYWGDLATSCATYRLYVKNVTFTFDSSAGLRGKHTGAC
jgi:hypothetical protein